MQDHLEVTDSTDWLSTPFAALSYLEASLRCQVCKDFFTTPVMTSCSHTFCSLCIRRYLSQEGRCPACRESDQEVRLRRNWIVEELVTNFTSARTELLNHAYSVAQAKKEDQVEFERPKKRQKVQRATDSGAERRSTRSQGKKVVMADEGQSIRYTEAVDDSEDDGSIYRDAGIESPPPGREEREPNDGRVACPCCGRRMKETLINTHLDKCVAGDSNTSVVELWSPTPQSTQPRTIVYAQTKPSQQQNRLPFINYSLLNESSLRRKLRDLGIPNQGTKELMRRRHTEWVNLWNANCDSIKPVAKRQLLQDLRVWEDTLGRLTDRVPASTGLMAKEFDRENHVRSQKNHFDDLIRQAREKRSVVTTKGKLNQEENKQEANAQSTGGVGSGAAQQTPMANATPEFVPDILDVPVYVSTNQSYACEGATDLDILPEMQSDSGDLQPSRKVTPLTTVTAHHKDHERRGRSFDLVTASEQERAVIPSNTDISSTMSSAQVLPRSASG